MSGEKICYYSKKLARTVELMRSPSYLFFTIFPFVSFAVLICIMALICARVEKAAIRSLSAEKVTNQTACRGNRPLDKIWLMKIIILLAAYFFIPMGSLPPFIPFRYGGIVFALLAACAPLAGTYKTEPFAARHVYRTGGNFPLFAAACAAALAPLSLYVSKTGVPGSIFSLGTYSATLLWDTGGLCVKAGMSFLMLSLCTAVPARLAGHSEEHGPDALVQALETALPPAVITAMFIPWNVGAMLGISGPAMFFFDFMLFWCKSSLLSILLLSAIKIVRQRRKHAWTAYLVEKKHICSALFWLAGALFLTADIYF